MNNQDYLEALIAPFGPKKALPDLIQSINLLYHEAEAATYDGSHPEIQQNLPELWSQLCGSADAYIGNRSLSVLDYGCGTGFATEQMVRYFGTARIAKLVCYDPCDRMLARCRERIFDAIPCAEFVNEAPKGGSYNLLLTNSVLHHLPDPVKEFRRMATLMARAAVWISGHEPSKRYFTNPDCRRLFTYARWAARIHRYSRLTHFRTREQRPAAHAAKRSHALGLFECEPSTRAIDRLVDYGVPHSLIEVECGRGFDVAEMEEAFSETWDCRAHYSYNFLGPLSTSEIPRWLIRRSEDLSARYPNDGANVAVVWTT